jgi:hypothetical protein
MAYPPPANTDDDSAPPDVSTAGAPRWVKVSGVIALLLVLLVVALLLSGGHGPGRHASTAGTGARTAAAGGGVQ